MVRGAHESAGGRLALRQAVVVLVERKSAVVGVELVVVASCARAKTQKINYSGTQQRILMKKRGLLGESVFFLVRTAKRSLGVSFVLFSEFPSARRSRGQFK